jgi:hypothetical protein
VSAGVPESPFDLVNLPEITDGTKIGIAWMKPYDRAAEITGYRITYKEENADQYTIEEVDGSYTSYTIEKLTQGNTYQVRVEARNIKGYSQPALMPSILVAQVPFAPEAPKLRNLDRTI